jgi:hypothetical protein
MRDNKSGGLIGMAKNFLKNANVGGGVYNSNGIKSVGGRIGTNSNYVGGTLGLQGRQPFGSANVNGKIMGSFGPQGN